MEKSYVCCYCGNEFEGEAEYCIPEGFPNDPEHEEKPLCHSCGGYPEPTLDVICGFLDAQKQQRIAAATVVAVAQQDLSC